MNKFENILTKIGLTPIAEEVSLQPLNLKNNTDNLQIYETNFGYQFYCDKKEYSLEKPILESEEENYQVYNGKISTIAGVFIADYKIINGKFELGKGGNNVSAEVLWKSKKIAETLLANGLLISNKELGKTVEDVGEDVKKIVNKGKEETYIKR